MSDCKWKRPIDAEEITGIFEPTKEKKGLNETAKYTSHPSLFDPLTLALSILIVSYLTCLLFI